MLHIGKVAVNECSQHVAYGLGTYRVFCGTAIHKLRGKRLDSHMSPKNQVQFSIPS